MTDSHNKVVACLHLSVDASIYNNVAFVYAKQYDVKSRYINVKLFSESGIVPISGTAQLNATLPNGQKIYVPGNINPDYSMDFSLKSDVLSLPGAVVCDVSVFGSDEGEQSMLTSSSFNIIVSSSQYSPDAWEGEDDENIFTETVATITEYAVQAADSAKSAQLSEENASKSETRADEILDSIEIKAEEFSVNCEAATAKVFEAENSAKKAAQSEANAKEYADTVKETVDALADDYRAVIEEVEDLKTRIQDTSIRPDDLSLEYDANTGILYPAYMGDLSANGWKISEAQNVATLEEAREYLSN